MRPITHILALPLILLGATAQADELSTDSSRAVAVINLIFETGSAEMRAEAEAGLHEEFADCVGRLSSGLNPISTAAMPVDDKVALAVDHCLQPTRFLAAAGAASPATRSWAGNMELELREVETAYVALGFGNTMFRMKPGD